MVFDSFRAILNDHVDIVSFLLKSYVGTVPIAKMFAQRYGQQHIFKWLSHVEEASEKVL